MFNYLIFGFSNFIGFTSVILGAESNESFSDFSSELHQSEKENKFEFVHRPLDVSQISNDMLQEHGKEFKKIVQKLLEYEKVLKIMKGCLERETEFYKSKMTENKERRNARSEQTSKMFLELKLSTLKERNRLIGGIKERIGRGEKLKFYEFYDGQEVEEEMAGEH